MCNPFLRSLDASIRVVFADAFITWRIFCRSTRTLQESKMSLIDLAGSERAAGVNKDKHRLKVMLLHSGPFERLKFTELRSRYIRVLHVSRTGYQHRFLTIVFPSQFYPAFGCFRKGRISIRACLPLEIVSMPYLKIRRVTFPTGERFSLFLSPSLLALSTKYMMSFCRSLE